MSFIIDFYSGESRINNDRVATRIWNRYRIIGVGENYEETFISKHAYSL